MIKYVIIAVGVLFTQFGSARYVQDLENAISELEAQPFTISNQLSLNKLYGIATGVSHDMSNGCKLKNKSVCKGRWNIRYGNKTGKLWY